MEHSESSGSGDWLDTGLSPLKASEWATKGLQDDVAQPRLMALLDQQNSPYLARNNGQNGASTTCETYAAYEPNQQTEQNFIDNCGKLNAAKAHFNLGPQPVPARGTFSFSTRNNNFS